MNWLQGDRTDLIDATDRLAKAQETSNEIAFLHYVNEYGVDVDAADIALVEQQLVNKVLKR